MKIFGCAIVMIAALLSSSNAYAIYYTGNSLKPLCDSGQTTADGAFCAGFVMGAYDMYDGLWGESSAICSPGTVTGNQLVAVSLKYFEDHPESMHEPAMSLVTKALVAAFPC